MNNYFVNIMSYCTATPIIIDEETLLQAERGENYLDPEDFMFLCEAPSMAEAIKCHDEEFSRHLNDIEGERLHP